MLKFFFLKNKLSVHRLIGFREHIYEFLVLLYRIQAGGPGVAPKKNIEKIDYFSLCNPQATHECLQKIPAHSVQPLGQPEGTYT